MTGKKDKKNELILYVSDDGSVKLDVSIDGDTVWLSQSQMAELFSCSTDNISLHLKNIYAEGELDELSTSEESSVVRLEGTRQVNRAIKHYNLDVIISVGYRVKSHRGTQFRKWATERLKEYIIKGFTMNDELLKKSGGGNYWRELLERIRDIRSSEKVFYRQILDLYATSVDYDPRVEESHTFFKIVQNKMHFAAHGHTAAEIINLRANAELPFMGLTSFEGAHPTKNEVGIAKNYLNEPELQMLNRLVSAFFDLAELKAMQHKPMYMKDWVLELDNFADSYGKGVLQDAGDISHKDALEKANNEYKQYKKKADSELSPVEKDYLESIKKLEKQLKD